MNTDHVIGMVIFTLAFAASVGVAGFLLGASCGAWAARRALVKHYERRHQPSLN